MSDEPRSQPLVPGMQAAGTANDFLAVYLTDCAAGQERSLADYQRMFPGNEAAIATEFAALNAEESEEALPTIPQVELHEVIGRGGQGTVYRGHQDYLDRPVAVKVLAPTFRHPQFVDRFRREARTLASLAHPSIVSCYQAGVTDDGQCYLVMELVDGPSLRARLDRSGPLPIGAALRMAHDLAAALAHAHENGVVHRDVKPENVLLDPWPEAPEPEFRWRARLADLGLARPQGLSDGPTMATPAGAVLGTPCTMAPEQFDAPESVDHRADIYGLGCVLYHAMTGEQAFHGSGMVETMASKTAALGPDPRKQAPGLPAAIGLMVQRMMAHAPEDRPQTYSEVLAEIEAHTPKTQSQAAARPSSQSITRPWLVWSAGAAIAMTLAIWWPSDDSRRGATNPAKSDSNNADRNAPAPVTWVATNAVEIFADGDSPFAEWQEQDVRPGRENSAPSLSQGKGLGTVLRALQPDNFELRGDLELRGRFVAGNPQRLLRAGVRIAFGPRLSIVLEAFPAIDGVGYDTELRWAQRSGVGLWQPGETIATTEAAASTDTKLPFSMTWVAGELVCSFGNRTPETTARVRPSNRIPDAQPTELGFFVEGGIVLLHDVKLLR